MNERTNRLDELTNEGTNEQRKNKLVGRERAVRKSF